MNSSQVSTQNALQQLFGQLKQRPVTNFVIRPGVVGSIMVLGIFHSPSESVNIWTIISLVLLLGLVCVVRLFFVDRIMKGG